MEGWGLSYGGSGMSCGWLGLSGLSSGGLGWNVDGYG